MTSTGHNLPETPTAETYGALDAAYDFFNERLFGGRLMPCLFVMQRSKPTRGGHFHAEIWQSQTVNDYAADEIAINPNQMMSAGLQENMQTLAHEMCHLEQHHFGKPSRNGYHNKEWGAMMDKIGLTPSNTGAPGGKRTGQQMADFIEPGGAFEAGLAELIDSGFSIPWLSIDTTPPPKEAKPSTRAKFTCVGCSSNAWGKPELRIHCADCSLPMIPSTAEPEDAAAMLSGYMKPDQIAQALGLSVKEAKSNTAQIDVEEYIAGAAA